MEVIEHVTLAWLQLESRLIGAALDRAPHINGTHPTILAQPRARRVSGIPSHRVCTISPLTSIRIDELMEMTNARNIPANFDSY